MRIDNKIMTYGTEAGEKITKTKNMLRVTEMKTLRSILEKRRRDRVRNEVIRDECRVQNVVRWRRQRKRQ